MKTINSARALAFILVDEVIGEATGPSPLIKREDHGIVSDNHQLNTEKQINRCWLDSLRNSQREMKVLCLVFSALLERR